MLECQNLYCQIWLKKSEYGRIWDESVFIYPKQFSKLNREKYEPLARHCISQLQTSSLQPSLAKTFAGIRSKVVPSLLLSGVVTKMAYGPGETDMAAICCRELFTAVTTVLEQKKYKFVGRVSPNNKF